MSKATGTPPTAKLTAAQQKILDIWNAHTRSEFVTKNVDETIATMIEGAHKILDPKQPHTANKLIERAQK